MCKYLKGFLSGVIVATLLINVALGDTVKKTIEVMYNSINIIVNGKKVDADNILYNGTTYVPLRAISEMLEKEVTWDQATSTASINDKLDRVNLKENRVNFARFDRPLIKYKNKYYSLDNTVFSFFYQIDEEKNLYSDMGGVLLLASIFNEEFKLYSSENPNLDGMMKINELNMLSVKREEYKEYNKADTIDIVKFTIFNNNKPKSIFIKGKFNFAKNSRGIYESSLPGMVYDDDTNSVFAIEKLAGFMGQNYSAYYSDKMEANIIEVLN